MKDDELLLGAILFFGLAFVVLVGMVFVNGVQV